MTRIRTFLLRDEIDKNQINHENVEGEALRLRNVDLGWSESEKSLYK